jgi:hypothetical protein
MSGLVRAAGGYVSARPGGAESSLHPLAGHRRTRAGRDS